LAIFNDLILIIGHDTLYIEDVFPSFEHNNTTHSLVRSDFCALVWVFGLFKGGALVDGRIILAFLAFLLKEGLQLGFAYAFSS
jgi:hypothetical protein